MKILLSIFLFFVSIPAWATTYYVRDGGGTSTQCTGTTNAVYTSGSGQPCAFNSPPWVMGADGGSGGGAGAAAWSPGDTMSIDGDSDINPGQQAQYMIGYLMPNTGSSCSTIYSYTCSMLKVPSGIDSSHRTTIIGTGTHKPQLWGTQGIQYILNLYPSTPPSSGTLTVVAGHGSGTSPITYTASVGEIFSMTTTGITTSPSIAATYTNNGTTFTVVSVNISGGSGTIVMSTPNFNQPPQGNGTLTKTGGTGDATITFSSYAFSTYAFTVSGVIVPPSPDDKYTTNNHTFDVVSNNLVAGAGSIQFNEEANLDIENLEITDHDSCTGIAVSDSGDGGFPAYCGGTGGSYPYGTWAKYGLNLEGTNITTKNLWVHRIALDDIWFSGIVSNWSSTNDQFTSSGESLDNSFSYMAFGGNNTQTNDTWAFGGCLEHYPQVDATNVRDTANYIHCADQNNSGLGGGFMMQANQAACGNWTIINSQFLFNLKTNIDFLHCDGTGTFNMYRSRSEGSSGEALKLHVATANIEETQLIGNAPVWTTAPFTAIAAILPIVCRGEAVTNFYTSNGGAVNFVNDDVTGNCTSLILTSSPTNLCSGMTINTYNTKFIGGYEYGGGDGNQVDLYYTGGTTGNNDGPCGQPADIPLTEKNNSCYGIHSYAGIDCTSGTNTVTADPKVTFELTTSMASMLGPTAYYSGTNFGGGLYLQSSSPLVGAGSTSGVTYTNGTTNDYNGFPANSPIDIGALYLNSCAISNGYCVTNSDCCSGTCSANNVCVVGNTDTFSGNLTITGVTFK